VIAITENPRQKRLFGWLSLAAWIVTFGSCCVAGVHRGTTGDPENTAAVAVFYAAAVVACILTAIRLHTGRRNFYPKPKWRPGIPEIKPEDLTTLCADHPVVAIHFWASWNGCDPPLGKSIDTIAPRFAGRVHFVALNTEPQENWEFLRRWNVFDTTILFFAGSDLCGRLMGIREPEQLSSDVNQVLGNCPQVTN
jgi:hypothetical protein